VPVCDSIGASSAPCGFRQYRGRGGGGGVAGQRPARVEEEYVSEKSGSGLTVADEGIDATIGHDRPPTPRGKRGWRRVSCRESVCKR